ncbi:MAG: aspartate-semialdehyde dehydrogenase [Calditrichaeota bacterium]|nr:aspartate-semialdehyde dehydrogenase [Calditrichota bacterium]
MSDLLDRRPFDLDAQSSFPFMESLPAARRPLVVGVIGATGAVGGLVVRLLRERNFPVGELRLFASERSAGRWVETPFGTAAIESLSKRHPPLVEVAFMAAGETVAREWGWRLARRGALVIDKSPYYRDKTYAPLVVPEVNGSQLGQDNWYLKEGEDGRPPSGIIANPNCTTIPLVMTLAPLHRRYGLRSVNVVSLQSVSGSGKKGIAALARELTDNDAEPSVYPHRIAYNVIPWIGSRHGSSSSEEAKLIYETRRILGIPRLPVQATALRVPTLVGHSLAVHIEFAQPVDLGEMRRLLDGSPGLRMVDDPASDGYPTPLQAQGSDDVLVGRIRRIRGRHGIGLFIVGDNLRKGAATNALQIAEYVLKIIQPADSASANPTKRLA